MLIKARGWAVDEKMYHAFFSPHLFSKMTSLLYKIRVDRLDLDSIGNLVNLWLFLPKYFLKLSSGE